MIFGFYLCQAILEHPALRLQGCRALPMDRDATSCEGYAHDRVGCRPRQSSAVDLVELHNLVACWQFAGLQVLSPEKHNIGGKGRLPP